MLYLIGLGLSDEQDITVKGLAVVKQAARVYLENYTSLLLVSKDRLEAFYDRKVILADREMVEINADVILENAETEDIAFLVVGDPFGATTHTDLVLRARSRGIKVKTIHNASIMNACGCTGLQLYQFGQTVSMVFFTETWRPESVYDKIKLNRLNGFHTLCLFDIKIKEPDYEHLAKTGKMQFEPPRFMSVGQCVAQLLEIEEKRNERAYTKDTLCIGLARVGADDQEIICATLEELAEENISSRFGAPLHSLIIIGKMHEVECEMVRYYAINEKSFDEAAKAHL